MDWLMLACSASSSDNAAREAGDSASMTMDSD